MSLRGMKIRRAIRVGKKSSTSRARIKITNLYFSNFTTSLITSFQFSLFPIETNKKITFRIIISHPTPLTIEPNWEKLLNQSQIQLTIT